MFQESIPTAQIASELRVSPKSVREWRRRWIAGGARALASAGPGGADCKLTVQQREQLAGMLDAGPVGHGWDDARWTLARVAELIERRFKIRYTLRGVSYLLHRMGYSLQVPARRSVERDEQAIQTWHRRRWPAVKASGGAGRLGLLPGRGRSNPATAERQDLGTAGPHTGGRRVGQGLRADLDRRTALPQARTSRPADVAYPAAPRPYRRTRQFQRGRLHRVPGPGHQRSAAPIVLCWDNLNVHISVRMRTLIAARDWLTVVRLPAYAPDLNPTEGVWSWTKRGIANTAIHGVDHLADLVKQRLRACQGQTNLIAGFLAQTGMTIEPEPP
jgi:transposase